VTATARTACFVTALVFFSRVIRQRGYNPGMGMTEDEYIDEIWRLWSAEQVEEALGLTEKAIVEY
jgi:hypothetical protein